MIATTPIPPYYSVIFTSIQNENINGYSDMSAKMLNLVEKEDGFLGVESARSELGITVTYWKDLESIKRWKANEEHIVAQQKGKMEWYKSYKVRIALVESDYEF
jgi:heme-degrading monooxygenase HmoA